MMEGMINCTYKINSPENLRDSFVVYTRATDDLISRNSTTHKIKVMFEQIEPAVYVHLCFEMVFQQIRIPFSIENSNS